MKKIFYFIISALQFIGCSHVKRPDVAFDDGKICYKLHDPNNFIVADETLLESDVKMCIVDTIENVSVLLFALEHSTLGYVETCSLVGDIVKQNNVDSLLSEKLSVQQSDFLGTDAWFFDSNISFLKDSIRMNVLFQGYIFEKYALVATSLDVDSLSKRNLQTYLSFMEKK